MAEKDISVAFTKQFQSEVKLAYQQSGSKLRNTVRTQNNIVGASTVLTGSAKARQAPSAPRTGAGNEFGARHGRMSVVGLLCRRLG